MKKGLTVTMLSVAVAIFGAKSMAMAPTIGDIRDIVVGDENSVTDPNEFVFADAVDLGDSAEDDGLPGGTLEWSFESATDPSHYTFNGVGALGASGDPVNPGALSINDQVLNGEDNPDSDPSTVTVRDVSLSPIGGPNTDPGTAGIVHSEAITLWVSDSDKVDSATIIVYTDNNGNDRLSPEVGPEPDPIVSNTFPGDAGLWDYVREFEGLGTVTSSTGPSGLCVEVVGPGLNVGSWKSDYGVFQLEDNVVYRSRFTLNSTQTTAGNVPLVDLVYDNFNLTGTQGANSYGGDYFFLDNLGGANAPGTVGRTAFEIWAAPLAFRTAQWRNATTGAFTAAHDPQNDMRWAFRVLDAEGPVPNAVNQLGTVCLQSYTIQPYDFNSITTVGAPLYEITNFTDASSGGNYRATIFVSGSTNISFANGDITVSPTDATNGWDNEFVQFETGNGDVFADPTNPNIVDDDYPIVWESEQLLMVTANLSADATGEAAPVDTIRLGLQARTNEIIGYAFQTPGLDRAGTPKQGTPQPYTMFVYTHSKTEVTNPTKYDRFRPTAGAISSSAFSFPTQGQLNRGALTFHDISVSQVTAPGLP